MLTEKVIFCFLALFLGSCLGATENYREHATDVVQVEQCAELKYGSELRVESTFIDPEFNTYTMHVDVERIRNFTITSLRVAELAYYITTMHDLMELPNNEEVREILSSGHFVVVEDPDVFNQLFDDDNPEKVGAFIKIPADVVCWDTPEDVKWSSIVRSSNWDVVDPKTIVHEMMHAVALATYGNSDSDHSEEFLWAEFGVDTLHSLVLIEYDKEYNRPPFTSNPTDLIP